MSRIVMAYCNSILFEIIEEEFWMSGRVNNKRWN